MMKRLLIITLIIMLLAILCACGEDNTASPDAQGPQADTPSPTTSTWLTDISSDDTGTQDIQSSIAPIGSTPDGWTGNKK